MRHFLTLLLLALISLPSAAQTIAFEDVTVLPMDDDSDGDGVGDRILANANVVVQDGLILAVGPAAMTPIPSGALTIPGHGRFLMPGLADMHVHIDHESDLGLYPAYGVTTVLNLRGLPQHLRWRAEIAAGQRFGPTLYTTGDYMDGDPPDMPTMMSFSTPEDAAASVVTQKKAGYDFLKVYSELSEEQFLATAAAAQLAGMAVVGHTSDNYGLETVLSGQVNFAHIEQAARYMDLEAESEEAEMKRLAQRIARSGATVTPNLGLHRAMVRMWDDLDALLGRPESRYLHPAIFGPFRRENNRYIRRSQERHELMRDTLIPRWERLTLALHEAGVPLLAGTDAPVAGSYPGSALWEELEALTAAGLEPYDVLVAATAAPGRFIEKYVEKSERFGQVRAGYRADLLLLEKNPLDDVRHVGQQAGVMLRGQWLPQAELQEGLEKRAADFASLAEAVLTFEKHLFAGELERAREVFQGVRSARPDAVLFSQYPPYFIGFRYLYGEDGFNEDPAQLRKALILYEMYAETYPEYHSSHDMLGKAYLANGEIEKAVASFERALAIHPHDPVAREELKKIQR